MQLPLSGINQSAVRGVPVNIPCDILCRPVEIKAILEDVGPQKIDTEHFRDFGITACSV